MRKICQTVCGTLALALVLAAGWAQAGGDKDLRAIIDKAIKAEGADKTDPKFKGLNLKGTGSYHGMSEEGIPFSGEWFFQGQTQRRFNMEFKIMDQSIKFVQVVNGNKGWTKINNDVKDMAEDELAEVKMELYVHWATTLLPLKDKAFKLAALGEVMVDGKAAVGIRVSHEGRRDINLYFDKVSGLQVKQEYQVKDVMGGGDKEMTQEVFLTDYKESGETKYPTKVIIKRDGKKFVEAEMSDATLVESIEPAVFERP